MDAWKQSEIARLLVGLLLACCLAVGASKALAADPAADSSAAVSADASAGNQPPANAPEASQESLLGWLHRSLGTRFAMIFLALTVALVALMIVSLLAVRRDAIAPLGLLQGLESRLGEDDFAGACELIRRDHSFLARVLAAGLPQLAAGDAKAAAAMEEFGSLESIKLHARLGHVWLVAQLAPLFGLLGTIDGLIAAFDAIVRKGATLRPIDLAGGVGTALVATAVGLWIAIVAVAFHQIVLARMDRLLAEAGILAERFAQRLAAARRSLENE